MSQWREVHIKFDAPDDVSREKLISFMDSFVRDHPKYLDPAESDFRVFGWVRKWDERTLSIHENEMCTALAGFENQVLPFFEELNSAIPGVSYEGELVRIDNGGEHSKQTRKVSFDGAQFTTDVDYWFEDEEELYEPSTSKPEGFNARYQPPNQVPYTAHQAELFLLWMEELVSGLEKSHRPCQL